MIVPDRCVPLLREQRTTHYDYHPFLWLVDKDGRAVLQC